jgi:hypothetical protein
MLRQAEDAAALITAHQPALASAASTSQDGEGSGIGLVLADAGYLSAGNLTTAAPTGSSLSASTGTWRKPHARPPK